jgi:polyhydroxyalkanoate synthesis regulator phasin
MSERQTQDGVQSTQKQDGAASSGNGALLSTDTAERYRNEWEEIQHRFVDEPQSSVEQADHLVEDLMRRLSATFTEERGRLESQWDSGDDVSTEDLRVALTRYRSFFERLLST